MHELADIFEPITPWGLSLVIVGLCILIVCLSCAWFVLSKRKNPIIKQLQSLDVRDSKRFAKDFGALITKARESKILKLSTLTQLEEFSRDLDVYKFAPTPPPLDSHLIARYQRICEIL